MRLSRTILLLMLFAGCGIEPHNTIGQDQPIHNGDHDKPKKPSVPDDSIGSKAQIFCKVQKVFDDNCIKCHSEKGQPPSLVRGFAQSALIDKKGHHGNYLVKPNASKESEIFNLITSTDPGHRMPKNAPPLKKEDIELIRTWIDTGASFTCSEGNS